MADLVERYQSEIVVGGETYSVSWTRSSTGITSCLDRVISVQTASFITLMYIGASAQGNQFVGLKNLTIINLDPTNYVDIAVRESDSAPSYTQRLGPGGIMSIGQRGFNATANDAGTPLDSTGSFNHIQARANTAACLVRLIAYE